MSAELSHLKDAWGQAAAARTPRDSSLPLDQAEALLRFA